VVSESLKIIIDPTARRRQESECRSKE